MIGAVSHIHAGPAPAAFGSLRSEASALPPPVEAGASAAQRQADRQIGGQPHSLLAAPTALAAQTVSQKPEAAADGQGGKAGGAKLNSDLSDEEKAQLQDLKARDREVRAHEHAHASAGAGLAGAPNYKYERGPDGAQYAVEGEVSIDTAPVAGDPQATVQKLRTVIKAALAPAKPSGQDRAVAAQAQAQLLQAQAEAAAQKSAERQGADPAAGTLPPDGLSI